MNRDPSADGEKPGQGPTFALELQDHDLQQRWGAPPLRRASWIGGQGTSPYEQKTQQSPCLGRRVVPQPEH